MTSPWFVSGPIKNIAAPTRLFCFPFAGGTGYEFRDWGIYLPNVEVLGVFYPGRASRYTAPLIDNLEEMVSAVTHELADYQDKPFTFFGHSLGALIAFEVTRRLRRDGSAVPKHLIVSACDAPHLLPVPPIVHKLPDDEFKEAIRDFGGTPEAILKHPEIVAMMIPILRADLKVLETYHYQPGPALDIPLQALGGKDDNVVPVENVLAWRPYTTNNWTAEFYQGGHFYYREQESGRFFAHLNQIIHEDM